MKHITLASLFAFILVFASCSGSDSSSGASVEDGMLTLDITMSDEGVKTLIPDIDMTPASYTVSGTGPEGTSFNESTANGTITIEGLAFGTWTIVAEAYNANSILIGRTTTTAVVHSNQNTNVNIIVKPVDGYGALNLTVNWITADVDQPAVTAQLIPVTGTAINLNFTKGTGTATYSGANIPTGYYSLSVKLLDNGITVMGAVEIVRIVNSGTTVGTYNFLKINQAPGGLEVNITPELDNPLTVTISGQVPELGLNVGTMTVTASVAENVGNVTYVWYKNSIPAATGASYTVNADKLGFYRLDVTAYANNGKRAGSQTCFYEVVECAPGPVTVAVASTATYGLEGDVLYFALYPEGTTRSNFGSANGGNMIALFTAVKQAGGSWVNSGGNSVMYNSSSVPANISCGNYVMGVILDKGGELAGNLSPFQNLGTGDLTYIAPVTVTAGGVTSTLPAGIFPNSNTPTAQGAITVVVDPSFTEGLAETYLHFRLFPIGTSEDDYDTTNTIAYQCYSKKSNGTWSNYYLYVFTTMLIPQTASSGMVVPPGHYRIAMILDNTPRISPWSEFPFAQTGTGDKTCTAYVTVDGATTFTVRNYMFFQ